MADEKQIDPEVVRILAAEPSACCNVVITLTPAAGDMQPAALALSKAHVIDGLPGMIVAELTAQELASLQANDAVQAIDLDSEQSI